MPIEIVGSDVWCVGVAYAERYVYLGIQRNINKTRNVNWKCDIYKNNNKVKIIFGMVPM